MVRLWTCSYAVSSVQRRVLVLRAGLGGNPAASVDGVAKALGLSSARVVRVQRAGLRGLRRAKRSDGCATGFSSPPAIAGDTQVALAVATASPLASVAQFADAAARRGTPARAGSGAVLAERVTSAVPGKSGRVPVRTAAAVPTSAEAGSLPLPVLLIMLLLAFSAAGFVLLRKRGMGLRPETSETVGAPPSVIAEPARTTPAPEPTPPPGPSYPPASSPASRAVASHDVRRAAGVAASGVASVLLGLALRARRRR